MPNDVISVIRATIVAIMIVEMKAKNLKMKERISGHDGEGTIHRYQTINTSEGTAL
jgi:hypothetical protein